LFLELKLGLIAESCLNPGFSTMIANIFAMRSDTEVNEYLEFIAQKENHNFR